MLAKLESLEQQFIDLEKQLSDPEIVTDQERYRKLTKAHSDLKEVVDVFRKYKAALKSVEENAELAEDPDPEMRALAEEEIRTAKDLLPVLEDKLKILLLPTDPMDEKNTILEIRAGTGGEEAALFAADLFRMYARYAEIKGWGVEILSSSETGNGGYKEIIALISGSKVYSRLKYESGTHRVQRVPATESQGRIHTSAVTVAILPEAEEVDVEIKPDDVRVDVFRSSGPGGQSVNTTDSAVRLTHLPTGITVSCQDEKSQHKNREKAFKVLRSRLFEAEQARQNQEMAANRKSQVGSGDRSERIRTYNYPQSRVTDHRINLTMHKLEAFMSGDIEEITDALSAQAQTDALKEQAAV